MTAEELSKDWTPEQKLRLTCALNLYQFAQLIMADRQGDLLPAQGRTLRLLPHRMRGLEYS